MEFAFASVEQARQALRRDNPGFAGEIGQLAIVGAGPEGLRLAELCRGYGIAVRAVVDDNPARCGQDVAGVAVAPFDSLGALDRAVPVVVASNHLLGPVRRLRQLGFAHVAGFILLQVLDPGRFPPHPFHERLLEETVTGKGLIDWLAGRLADERSRLVLDRVVRFRLSLDPAVLADVVEGDLYGPDCLASFPDGAVYVDGGAFDGDSVRWFIERSGERFSRILAFEPDPATHARLAAAFAADERVTAVAAGLWDHTTTLRFVDDGSRGATLSGAGTVAVPVSALDDVLAGARADFIKMNIEGAELNALAGARRTIATHRPQLAVSVYHRPAHLWEVAQAIDAIVPGYRFHLRQHEGGLIETVLYAVSG